jgi:hypothetical protein
MQQGAVMAKAKKVGPREPNGRISRAKEPAFVPIQQVRAMIRGGKLNGMWNQPLGVMCLNERITQAQMDAGNRFALQRQAWEAATGCPPRNTMAQDVNRAVGRSGKPEDGETTRRAVDAYTKATVALGGWSSPQHKAILRVAVDLLNPDDYQQVLDLIAGLNTLQRHYGGRG